MKQLFSLIICVFACLAAQAQDGPSFPGGKEAMKKFISENIQYPQSAIAEGLEGTLYVRFDIAADGTVSNVVCASPTGTDLDAEAVRVVSTMPKWTDTEGKNHNMTIPVDFVLPESAVAPAQAEDIGELKTMPLFPGGGRAMDQFISKNTKMPEVCKQNKIEGDVHVELLIDKDGNVADAVVVQGVHPELDAEALRIARLMPRWTPATTTKGITTSCKMRIRMVFRNMFGDKHVPRDQWI